MLFDRFDSVNYFFAGGAQFVPLPTGEDEKAMYALGINIALQVGGELKNLLSPEEIKHLIDGFGSSLSGAIPNEREILMENGKRINEIITKRSSNKLTTEKKKGQDYIQSYLLSHPRAQQLPSGLIFDEIIAGIGEQVIQYYVIRKIILL
jgi:uncharacterized protein YnzC (UPF0291/DUF896 family)